MPCESVAHWVVVVAAAVVVFDHYSDST